MQFPIEVIKIANHIGYKVHELVEEEICGISGKVCHKDKIIYVNPADIKTRQRFTIAHEIGHILLHVDNSDIFLEKNINICSEKITEIEANRFAIILLMPTLKFRRQWSLANSLNLNALEELANFFQVSKLAVSIRANNLGLLSL